MLNSSAINDHTLNGGFAAAGSGLIISAEQSVKIMGSGLIISIEQNTELLQTGSGLIISIEQNTKTTFSGLFISIEQRVRTLSAASFLGRNGYDCDIYIGGYAVPKSMLTGSISINKLENRSSSLKFTMLPAAGIQSPETYQGKAVYANLTDSSGTHRAFSGFIDTPIIDLVEKKITFECSDRRTSQLLSQSQATVNSIGYFSNDVFGVPKDQSDELEKRITTIPSSMDFDNFGNLVVTPWRPKSVPDYTLSGGGMYYDKPNVTYTNRTNTLNTVTMTLNYSFQRLHQQIATISWAGYNNFLTNWFNVGTPSFPRREMIANAANASDWKPVGNISYTSLWPAGGFGTVQWQPNQVTYEYGARISKVFIGITPSAENPTGLVEADYFVLDALGKKIYDVISVTTIDTSSMLCRGASWSAGLKFSQNVTYSYEITLQSPQAVSRFGVINDVMKVSATDPYETALWERDTKLYTSSTNFFMDKKPNFKTFLTTMDVAIRKAQNSIVAAHRDVAVNFRHRVWAGIDLKHTVQTTATQVSCIGKVSSISHMIDISTGEGYTDITLLLSRSFGGDTLEDFNVPSPTDSAAYIGAPTTITLGTHNGINPDPSVTTGAEIWNGYIGNKTMTNTLTANVRTDFAESFIVDYPAVPETIRGDRTVTSTSSFTVVIENNDLEVIF
jgi:hypothetical protein